MLLPGLRSPGSEASPAWEVSKAQGWTLLPTPTPTPSWLEPALTPGHMVKGCPTSYDLFYVTAAKRGGRLVRAGSRRWALLPADYGTAIVYMAAL